MWNSTNPTDTVFSISGSNSDINGSGKTYVAYLFAHDAGGFGLTETDNVISCGSYAGSAGEVEVNLGYEPQWLLIKQVTGTGFWAQMDNMRGIVTGGTDPLLVPNAAVEEVTGNGNVVDLTSTGFKVVTTNNYTFNGAGHTYIYIAIRRGPMKVPTTGTSVFLPVASSAATGTSQTTGFPVDFQIAGYLAGTDFANWSAMDRLRGVSSTTTEKSDGILYTSSTTAEGAAGGGNRGWVNTGFLMPGYWGGIPSIFLNFRRAPGFFDEVCWTGNNSTNQRVSHNLGVTPELIIYKGRNKVNFWRVYFGSINTYIQLDAGIAAVSGSNFWGSSAPTATDFGINCGSMDLDNFNAVGYLFATCPGVSKVGSFTGTGATQVINCGFTGGARFVLIKATSTTGNWLVWDSARGIVAGNDPYLELNSTAAEVTNTDWVDTAATGFELSNAGGNLANSNGVSYIFLAIS
jgi:hypothetical protein